MKSSRSKIRKAVVKRRRRLCRNPATVYEETPLQPCERCSSLDFLQRSSISLGLIQSWSLDSCNVCQWFHTQVRRTWPSERTSAITLVPLAWTYIDWSLLSDSKEITQWQIEEQVSTSFVSSQYGKGPLRLLNPNRLDFSIVRGWLKTCQELHPTRCGTRGAAVPGLRVIDCKSRTIVPATGAPYVTLSYMWGREKALQGRGNRLPEELPDTIVDAVTVTMGLGYRYLWIDRYCIDQQDSQQAHVQMAQMDIIYYNSSVTIVAVAGKDPTYGLPGVGRRSLQPRIIRVGPSIVASSSDAASDLEQSTWNGRGWTYQEGVLSRRRLLFWDHQATFECRGMQCQEILDVPYASMHSGESLQDKYDYGIFPQGTGVSQLDILEQIRVYTEKELSYKSDRQKAFLGVLRFYNQENGLRHLWGSPIFHPPDPDVEFEQGLYSSRFPESLFLRGLCWEIDLPMGVREPYSGPQLVADTSLPSWSWTGWSCPVTYGDTALMKVLALDVKVQIEQENGQTADWNSFCANYKLIESSQLGRYIHLEAWTVPVQFSRKGGTTTADIEMYNGTILRLKPNEKRATEFIFEANYAHDVEGLLLCNSKDYSSKFGLSADVYMLFAQEADSNHRGRYKRRIGGTWLGYKFGWRKTWQCALLVTLDGMEHDLHQHPMFGYVAGKYGTESWWKAMNPVRKVHRLG